MSAPKKDSFPGMKNVLEALQNVDQKTYENILSNLARENQALVRAILEQMFTFDHLHMINPNGLQTLIGKFDLSKWAIALKTAKDEVKEAIFANVSERMRKNLKEEMLSVGKRKLSEVQDVQKEIMSLAKEMKDSGELIVANTPEDPMV